MSLSSGHRLPYRTLYRQTAQKSGEQEVRYAKGYPAQNMPNFQKITAIFDVFGEERISGGELCRFIGNGQK